MRQHLPAILAIFLCTAVIVSPADAQQNANELPNPYRTIENHFKLPDGRTWGAISAVDVAKDGRSIWIAERCGGNSGCPAKPTIDPILLFDPSGKLVRSFGAGLIMSPHGIHVDRDGNIWVTDYSDNAPRAARGGAPSTAATKGHQVFKFSPEGKLLLTLGTAGGSRDSGYFYQPNDVLVAPNGDIFVSQGHGPNTGRILKFDSTGKLIQQFGKSGSGPGEFNVPHALAMDSRGRLFIGDRGNNRVQIFDQDGNYLEEWKQFGRPSGIFIDKNDVLYVADSESDDARNPGMKRGIRIGSARDGKLIAFIPDPWTAEPRPATTSPEGVAADADGNIYGAEVTETNIRQYVKK
jgi:DNA-binding beta-propeller fold protein YncE